MKALGVPFFYGFFPFTINSLGTKQGAYRMFLIQLIPSVVIWIILIRIWHFTFGITTIKEVILKRFRDKIGWDQDKSSKRGASRFLELASEFFLASWQLLPFLVPLWFHKNKVPQHWSIELGEIILSSAIMTVYWTLISIGLIRFAAPIVIVVIAYLVIRAIQKYYRYRVKS